MITLGGRRYRNFEMVKDDYLLFPGRHILWHGANGHLIPAIIRLCSYPSHMIDVSDIDGGMYPARRTGQIWIEQIELVCPDEVCPHCDAHTGQLIRKIQYLRDYRCVKCEGEFTISP